MKKFPGKPDEPDDPSPGHGTQGPRAGCIGVVSSSASGDAKSFPPGSVDRAQDRPGLGVLEHEVPQPVHGGLLAAHQGGEEEDGGQLGQLAGRLAVGGHLHPDCRVARRRVGDITVDLGRGVVQFYIARRGRESVVQVVAFGLGLMGFCIAHYAGIKSKGFKAYAKEYCEPMFFMMPLNVIGELAKIVSISFRLFGNIMGGSIIILVVSHLVFSVVLPPFLNAFFGLFVGTIQAFVFTMLTVVYISVQVK